MDIENSAQTLPLAKCCGQHLLNESVDMKLNDLLDTFGIKYKWQKKKNVCNDEKKKYE